MQRTRIAVVGLRFGRHIVEKELLDGPGQPFFDLTTVVDLDQARAATLAAQHGLRTAPSLDAALADPAIDAIGLFTRPEGRAELIRRCVQAGKPVMTTKPFERDPDAALAALRAAQTAGVPVHLNSPSPLLPADLRIVKEWERQIELGRPVGARADVWASYHDKADGSWYDDPDRCPVAPIFRLGIYLVNDLLRLFGKAKSVSVMHSRLITERPTPDNAQLSMQFENGALGNVFASFCVDDGEPYKNSLVLNYEHGTVYRNIGPRNRAAEGSTEMMCVTNPGESSQSVARRSCAAGTASGAYQWEAFSRAVRGERLGDELDASAIVDGIRVIAAMRRAELSARTEPVV